LIAVTASAMVGDRDKVIAMGFDGYISKPITPETFVAEVEGYLHR
jgi:CheY-like chemotaxis protein